MAVVTDRIRHDQGVSALATNDYTTVQVFENGIAFDVATSSALDDNALECVATVGQSVSREG